MRKWSNGIGMHRVLACLQGAKLRGDYLTIDEIAKHIGRSKQVAYYHLKRLEQSGYVKSSDGGVARSYHWSESYEGESQ